MAQTPGLQELPPSVRALSMGGAFPLADRDPDLLFGNPALLERARGFGISLHLLDTDVRMGAMSAATGWFGGGAGVGLRFLERGDGDELVNETELSAGYARTVKGVRVGATLAAVQIRSTSFSDAGASISMGAASDLGPVTVALSGGGMGPTLDLPDGVTEPRPWGRVGIGTRAAPVGPLDVGGAAAITVREGGEVEGGGGVEVGWWPVQGRTFVGRIGWGGAEVAGTSQLSLGAAFLGDNFTLEYGWRPRTDARGVHAVGVRFR